MTTDVAAAKTFYVKLLGWNVRDASTREVPYMLFTAAELAVGGLMELPQQARQMGATPRWMGYVGVHDAELTAARIRRLGGAVLVEPTMSNIGRISVVADPQNAIFGLAEGLNFGQEQGGDILQAGRVGWHELLASDQSKAFAFYRELFGWDKADAELGPSETYQLFSAEGQTIGGIFNKRPIEAVPYWLYYFNVDDVDAAAARVKSGGGQVFEGPFEVPGASWIVRCIDPQGAIFAIQGKRSRDAIAQDPAAEVGWSTEWSGISSRGKLVNRPKG